MCAILTFLKKKKTVKDLRRNSNLHKLVLSRNLQLNVTDLIKFKNEVPD